MRQYPHNILKGDDGNNRYVLKEHIKLETCKFTGTKDFCLYGINKNGEIKLLIDKDLEVCTIFDKEHNKDTSCMVRQSESTFCYEFEGGKVILYKDTNNDIFVIIGSF